MFFQTNVVHNNMSTFGPHPYLLWVSATSSSSGTLAEPCIDWRCLRGPSCKRLKPGPLTRRSLGLTLAILGWNICSSTSWRKWVFGCTKASSWSDCYRYKKKQLICSLKWVDHNGCPTNGSISESKKQMGTTKKAVRIGHIKDACLGRVMKLRVVCAPESADVDRLNLLEEENADQGVLWASI